MTISQRESQDKRGELLERAMELFAARGYDAVGVQEIAEAAGVTKPTLYYYFGNKEGLLRALLEGRYQALEAGIRAALDYRHDLSATLRNVASPKTTRSITACTYPCGLPPRRAIPSRSSPD